MNIATLLLYPCDTSGLQSYEQRALRAVATHREPSGQSHSFQPGSAHKRAIALASSHQFDGGFENDQRARFADRMFMSWRDA